MKFEPEKITKEHILKAVQIVDSGNYDIRDSIRYDAIVNGRSYPPKELMRYAHEIATGDFLWNHSGGETTNKYIKKLGFDVVDKKQVSNLIQVRPLRFKKWLTKEYRQGNGKALTVKSIDSYYNGIKTIDRNLKERGLIREYSLFIIDSVENLNILFKKYFSIPEVDDSNRKGKYMYSNSFEHYIEFIDSILNKKRIARLCWNDKGWVQPSGKIGKSNNRESHEGNYGYGHEEWLFDTSKLIDGYHYGFLEPIRKQQDTYENNVFDVWLYTINNVTKKRYWIGEIFNVEVISTKTSENIKAKYIAEEWLGIMEEEIKFSGANAEGFSNWKGVDLFNIRFFPSNIKLNDNYILLPPNHPIYNISRYTFAHFKEEFNLIEPPVNDNFEFSTLLENTTADVILKKNIYYREPKSIEITYLHKAISDGLVEKLKKIYGKDNVRRELPSGYGLNRIDIVVKLPNGFIFYEIKTYPTIKASIREAVGQLMEYSLWSNSNKAKELIIITQPHNNSDEAKIYVKHLRESFNLPIYYQEFDFEEDSLSEKS